MRRARRIGALKPALLIHNPAAGGRDTGRLLEALVASLSASGFDAAVEETGYPGHATELARRAVDQGSAEVVFACGGDGTLREVAAGLHGSKVPIGLVPAGTTNVLARGLGIPRKSLAAANCYDATCSPTRKIDVGYCNGAIFLMMASIGVDAEVLRQTSPERKRRWGRMAILATAVSTTRTYTYPKLQARIRQQSHEFSFLAACNIRHYGGSFQLTPDAEPDDGLLDVLLFEGGAMRTLGLLRDVVLRRHRRRRDVAIVRASSVRIEGDQLVTYQCDGDWFEARLPFEIEISEPRLRVLMPA